MMQIKTKTKLSETSGLKPFEYQCHLLVIFWISDGHFSMSQRNENTDIERGLICLWHDP